jgi:beta-lactam-binding protein with PASTA domain
MHDEEHTHDTEAELPAPEGSPFFTSADDPAENPPADLTPGAAPPPDPEGPSEPELAAEPATGTGPEPTPGVDPAPGPTPQAAPEPESPKRWGLFGRRKKKASPAESPAEPPAVSTTESVSAEAGQQPLIAPDGAIANESAPVPESPSASEPFATDVASAQADPDSTQPYTPIPEDAVDGQAGQLTQLLPEIDTDSSMYFDPESSQFTVVMPLVDPEPTAQAPTPEPSTSAEKPVAVVAGSRVVIVVSKGASEIAPASMATVPVVARVLQGAALSQLQQAGLSAQVFNEYSDLPRGEVIGQWPSAGQSVPTGSEAVLLVSNGPAPDDALSVPLPQVIGLSEADALAALQAAGLSPQIVREYSQSVPLGAVMAQLPHGRVDAAPKKPKGEAGSLWWLWALLAFAVLFAVSGGVYYYVNRSAAVPNLVGLTQAQAEEALDAAGFKAGSVTTTQSLDASQVGKVIGQTPAPNSQLRLIDKVNLTISGGQKLFAVPDVVGRGQDEARSIMTTAGLQVALSQTYSATVPKDAIISQSPPAGERVPYQTTVGLTVSLGVQNVTVPGVGGLTRSDAANRLKSANLGSQAVVEYTYAGSAKGLVFAQYPTAGMQIAPGTIVGLLVSNGPPPSKSPSSTPTPGQLATVPSVVGQGLKSAQSTLKKANLSNTIINWSGTGRPAGEVVGQAPEVNTTMPRGVAVIIFVSNGK